MLLGVSEPNSNGWDLAFQLWNPFHLQSLSVLFPFTNQSKQTQPNPLFFPGGGHFSQERPSNHCRWSLNSWGWWQEKDMFGKYGEAPFILISPQSFNICIYKNWFGFRFAWLQIGGSCSYKSRQEAVECIYYIHFWESSGCMAHVEACPIREVVQDSQHSTWQACCMLHVDFSMISLKVAPSPSEFWIG